MAKNYGKRNASRRDSGLLGQFLSFVVIFCFGYLTASVFDYTQLMSWIQARFSSQHASQHANITQTNQAALPKPKFEFYTLLANDHVTTPARITSSQSERSMAVVVPQSVTPKAKVETIQVAKAPSQSSVHEANAPQLPLHGALSVGVSPQQTAGSGYLVQVASFRLLREAEKMKGALTLRGFDVKVVHVSQQNVDWYRVMLGPFASRDQAQKAQMAFARTQHIMGMIRRMDA